LRIPFWISLILLVFSVYIRLRLNESPIFAKMKEEGKGSTAPLTESFLHYRTTSTCCSRCSARPPSGCGVVHGPVLRAVFLTITLKLDYISAYSLIALSLSDRHAVLHRVWLAVGPYWTAEDHPGRLLDRGDHVLPAVQGLTHYVNPTLKPSRRRNPITVSADQKTCNFHIFVGPWSNFTQCDRARTSSPNRASRSRS